MKLQQKGRFRFGGNLVGSNNENHRLTAHKQWVEYLSPGKDPPKTQASKTPPLRFLAIRKAIVKNVQSKYLLKVYIVCPNLWSPDPQCCSGALVWSKLSRVVYATIDHTAGGCNSLFNICSNRRLNHRIEVLNGILEDECTALLTSWFSAKRNRDQEL